MKGNLYVDINYQRVNYHGDRICGDNFVQRYIPSQQRTVAILSDGMGHGIKANILSTLTSSIIVNMIQANEEFRTIAHTILKTLPVCSVRGISYSTFTIIDISHKTNKVSIVEYDNPQSIILRDGQSLPLEWDCGEMDTDKATRRTLLTTSFEARQGDRIIFCSDGVTQSGLGTQGLPFGWGGHKLEEFARGVIRAHNDINARDLAVRVVERAIALDKDHPKDDISCVSILFRRPARLLFCSCPPTIEAKSQELTETIVNFDGACAIAGYPLAELVAAEMNVEIDRQITSADPEVPPMWHLPGVDLATEGLITLGKVLDILERYPNTPMQNWHGAAYSLVGMLLNADVVEMIVGLRERVDTPTVWADDYVLRRKVLRAIAELLDSKFNKQVIIRYL